MDAGGAEFGILCADHHSGYSRPVSSAIAYEGYVSPAGVGYDIGCGDKAVRTELTREDLDALGGVPPIMREITRRVSFGTGVLASNASTTQTRPCSYSVRLTWWLPDPTVPS